MSEDGHSTKCTFRKCGHPESPFPCPFRADEKPEASAPASDEHVLTVTCSCGGYHNIKSLILHNNSRNRGERWMD